MQLENTAVMITACSRPDYLTKTLRSWREARGIMGTHSFTVALGGNSQAEPAATVPGMRGTIRGSGIVTDTYRDRRPGAGLHYAIWDAANYVFNAYQDVDFLIFGEEDIVVGQDVFEYFDWARDRFGGDPRVLLACAHNRGGQGWDAHRPAEDADEDEQTVALEHYFNAWVWGTWRDRWMDTLRRHWELGPNHGVRHGGYDWNVQNRFMGSGAFYAAVPAASRTQNIGRTRGVYATETSWRFSQSKSFNRDRGPVEFRLV
jgi:hypothetical protein